MMESVGVPPEKIVWINAPKMPAGRVGAGCSAAHFAVVDQLLRSLEEDGSPQRGTLLERYAVITEESFKFRIEPSAVQEALKRAISADYYSAATDFTFDVIQMTTGGYDFEVRPQETRGGKRKPTAAGVDCFPCTKKHQKLFLGSGIRNCCGQTWEEVLGLVRAIHTKTTAGYIVKLNQRILTLLRDQFRLSAVHMDRQEYPEVWAADMAWLRLQGRNDIRW
eukprot:GHVU01013313.1.p1 GENE.GHVU01013313.1~~GHVU01013313.1.p1  ORF type:complete len:222 (+),score=27.97 GHVU01013313.1:1350-2015(+)